MLHLMGAFAHPLKIFLAPRRRKFLEQGCLVLHQHPVANLDRLPEVRGLCPLITSVRQLRVDVRLVVATTARLEFDDRESIVFLAE